VTEPASPSAVEIITTRPPHHRAVPLLAEHQLDHYPEFRDYLRTTFDLDTNPFGPAPIMKIDRRAYELTFVGQSGRTFPTGLRIAALVPGLEPLDDDVIDNDLWMILQWLVDGVGHEWTNEALTATGHIYRIPSAPTRQTRGRPTQ
jgi:hypothetical protein